MPIYEYECPTCGERFERLVKLSAPIPECPACHGNEVRKRVSVAAFVLKGSGWYKDHYGLKSSPESKSEKSESKESKGSEAPAPAANTSPTPSPAASSASPSSSAPSAPSAPAKPAAA
jgi:putative FmdB family regulatory protein